VRALGSGLRRVHRGLRHRRSERGQGAARRAGVRRQFSYLSGADQGVHDDARRPECWYRPQSRAAIRVDQITYTVPRRLPEFLLQPPALEARPANLNEPRKCWLPCDADDHKIALFTHQSPPLDSRRRSGGTPSTCAATSAYIRHMYDNINYKLGITCQLSNPGPCPKFRCRSAADAVSAHKIPLPSGAAKSCSRH
jgi:hypothetical protein